MVRDGAPYPRHERHRQERQRLQRRTGRVIATVNKPRHQRCDSWMESTATARSTAPSSWSPGSRAWWSRRFDQCEKRRQHYASDQRSRHVEAVDHSRSARRCIPWRKSRPGSGGVGVLLQNKLLSLILWIRIRAGAAAGMAYAHSESAANATIGNTADVWPGYDGPRCGQ
jgi:hypothetical protein